mmetsp:Transcript_4520/g.7588  ORF Transcript_4520/g.7588 Transcript_4520/m.7588 type:complete len:717 (-) Transcript_4520:357-2507(-)
MSLWFGGRRLCAALIIMFRHTCALSYGVLPHGYQRPSMRVSSRWSDTNCVTWDEAAWDEWNGEQQVELSDDVDSRPDLSVMSASSAFATDTIDDVESLVDEWREAIAIEDEDGGPPTSSQQEYMMKRWRMMIEKRERELRRAGRASFRGCVPAHLTGWFDRNKDGVGPVADAIGSEIFDTTDAELSLSESYDERDDDSFVYAWQCHAEQMRQQTAEVSSAVPSPVRSVKVRGFGWARKATEMQPCIGIDLGTTNSAIAAVSRNRPYVIPTADGSAIFPSCVSFVSTAAFSTTGASLNVSAHTPLPPLLTTDVETALVVVGEKARRQFVTNTASTYSSTKRLIGRTATAAELRSLAALEVPYRRSANGEVLLACPALRRTISAVDISAELVRQLLLQAEAELGQRVRRAVVTVPAYFGDAERAATETACLLAGLDEVRLMREPEAAALLYALDQKKAERVMVFDLGGGTFDVSIVDVGGSTVEVIATSGDPRLGGDDWDRVIADWLADQFSKEYGILLDGFARRRLIDAAEEAKQRLSSHTSVQVEVPFLHHSLGVNVTLSRRKFEALCRHLLLRLVPPVVEVAESAGIQLSDDIGTLAKGKLTVAPPRVQEWRRKVAWRWQRFARRRSDEIQRFPNGVPISKVLLVGGSSRMPCIGRLIKKLTGLTVKPSVSPEESVALGAAVQAAILEGQMDKTVVNPFFHERTLSKLADTTQTE